MSAWVPSKSRTPTHVSSLVPPSSRTPTHTSSLSPGHTSHTSHTPTHDVSNYCTINRKTSKRSAQKKSLDKRQSESTDDIFTGTRISKVPDPVDYTLKVQQANKLSEIDLDLIAAQKTVEQLKLNGDKPHLSENALNRVSRRHRVAGPGSTPPISSLATNMAVVTEGISMSLERIPGEHESTDGFKSFRSRMISRDAKSASPAPLIKTMSTGNVPSEYNTSLLLPAIEIIDEERGSSNPNIHTPLSSIASNSVKLPSSSSSATSSSATSSSLGGGARFLTEDSEGQTRHSIRSIDSGLGESDDPTQVDRDSASEGVVHPPPPSFGVNSLALSQPLLRQESSLPGISRLKLPKGGFSSLRAVSKRHRKSMLLSELCVVTVSVPANITRTQRGRGSLLKFRFSPYTQIEFLRVAILKQFHERLGVPIPQLSKLHLCRYLEDEEGWEWLEEDQNLHQYHLPTECKLELKPLEPVYHDVRVVIPQLESSMSVEYDQFSTVGDVLHQVLSLSEPPLENAENHSLFHVRLRMHMDSSDSMVYYQILPADVLECRLSVGRLHSVILTIKIPAIHSCRKVKVSLDETVGELISTLMRRVPDPDSSRWYHMSLLLHSGSASAPGIWMEDYKFLAAYKLKASDVIDFRPKYRPMLFELRVFPHDQYPDDDNAYTTPELLVAQDTTVAEVISLLCNSASLEYDPRFYGLFFHDDAPLPMDTSMWDHLDTVNSTGYQDSLILHMIHKPLKILFEKDEDSFATINVNFSQPCHVLRGILCRRYGVHHHYVLRYEGTGIILDLNKSLHSQGVLEQECVSLVHVPPTNTGGPPAKTEGATTRNETLTNSEEIDTRRLSMAPENEVNVWDEGEDCSLNIRIDPHKGVVAATFNKLVEKLTSERDHDLEFVKTFLYTYQSYATPERLLKKLIERYNVIRSSGVSFKNFAVVKQTIQARVINALKLWVDLSVDFKDNVSLQDQVLHFISTVLILDHPRLSKPLRTNILAIKGVIQKKNLKMFRDPPPPVKIPANITPLLTIFDFDPEEVARQMTVIDFSLFDKIKPAELLNQAWQKPKYKHRAVNILRLVERMNNLTLWVATTILSQRDIHDRARRISDFVAISQHLLEMHNLCTLMSLLNGLAHPSITRLKKSFAKLDKATTKKIETLQTLARPGDNFRLLRDELKRASNPCIPYLGLYMSDLTFIDNGNPNYCSDSLINFSKCRLIYSRIRDLILRQDKSYNFEEVPALHESLTKFHFLDTDVLYDVSLQREPRDKGK